MMTQGDRYTGKLSAYRSSQQYSSPFLNTYAFISPKVAILAEKKQNCFINVLSKVRFKENIEIQQEPRFRGYSMNTLNTHIYVAPGTGTASFPLLGRLPGPTPLVSASTPGPAVSVAGDLDLGSMPRPRCHGIHQDWLFCSESSSSVFIIFLFS